MNKEDLFECFGALDDDLLRRSEHKGKAIKKERKISGFLKYGSIAACLVVVLVVVILFIDNKSSNPDLAPESYVNISTLLASNTGVEEQTLEIELIEIEKYSAQYYKVASVESDILKERTGSKLGGTKAWYRVSGHKDMQYLISCNNNEYSLWKFDFFQQEKYPYSDVLQIIYNIHSVEDITKIVVSPADMDNSDEGQAIQKEIGTSIVTGKKAIETIYNVLSGLTCYGGDNWEMIGLGDDTPSSMLNQVKAGRYLTVVTSQGMEIDTLKYTGISGMFYEYGGIAYSSLTKEEKTAVEKILNIELTE